MPSLKKSNDIIQSDLVFISQDYKLIQIGVNPMSNTPALAQTPSSILPNCPAVITELWPSLPNPYPKLYLIIFELTATAVFLMQQQLQVQLTHALREDLSTPILRYYLQEDAFNCNPSFPQQLFQLPFNQIVAEVVAEVTLSNKQITNNSRVAANLLQNGKEIFRNKKLQYFKAFLLTYEYISWALQGLSKEQKSVFQYTVMAISNLILKLSLNMSRISVVILAKQFTVPMLNPFITAILFQKFLEKEHLRSKEANRKPEDHSHLLKQFPKITLIKISQTRNPFDRYFINQSQQLFGNEAHKSANEPLKLSSSEPHNVQFIEIYEKEGEITSHHLVENSQKQEAYNLHEQFGLSSPLGMEFYLFFTEIIVPKIQSYKPDIVIYYEDMPCEPQAGINAAVKGLILNTISQKIQNKIYVFKEFGIAENSPLFSNIGVQHQKYRNSSSSAKSTIENLLSTYDEQLIRKSGPQSSFFIKELQMAQSALQNSINKSIIAFRNAKIKARLFKVPETKATELQITLKKMRGLLFEELSYISLALLQRQNFQNISASFRNYSFPKDFLQRFISWGNAKLEQASKTKTFSDEIISLEKKIYMLQGMLEMSAFTDDETSKSQTDLNQSVYYFYNFAQKRVQKLTSIDKNQVVSLTVSKNDQIYFHYTKSNLIVFLVTQHCLRIYTKRYQQAHLKCIRDEQYEYESNLSAKHSTLVATNKFFYKCFGQFEGSLSGKSYICSLRIDNLEDISKTKVNKWRYFEECIQGVGKLRLQLKIWGWGWAVDDADSSLVILGGGYNFACQNEQKVNKFFYIISNNSQVFKIGKVSSDIVNLPQNIKNKNTVIPCVYGIPLTYAKNELVLLNSNGYCQKLNHQKKMFLTKIRVENESNGRQICVIAQNRMDYNTKRVEQDIANKNTILSYMLTYYNQINRWEGQCSYCDSEGNVFMLKVDEEKAVDSVRVEFVPKEKAEMCEEYRTYQIQFGKTRLVLNGEMKQDLAKKKQNLK